MDSVNFHTYLSFDIHLLNIRHMTYTNPTLKLLHQCFTLVLLIPVSFAGFIALSFMELTQLPHFDTDSMKYYRQTMKETREIA